LKILLMPPKPHAQRVLNLGGEIVEKLPQAILDLIEQARQAEKRVVREKLRRGFVPIGLVAQAARLRVEAARAQAAWQKVLRDAAPDARPEMKS